MLVFSSFDEQWPGYDPLFGYATDESTVVAVSDDSLPDGQLGIKAACWRADVVVCQAS